MSDRYASIASATATSIDSAAKHNLQCRMYTELIQNWAAGDNTDYNSADIIKANKMDYCMHKDEIVLGVCTGLFKECCIPHRPYPLVFTTYGKMSKDARNFLKKLYQQQTSSDIDALVDTYNDPNKKTPHDVKMLPQFYFQGVSLGVAYAHPDSGDTVGTVMYGGLRTILNGHFNGQNGQPCMWYFDFEVDQFDSEGRRIDVDNLPLLRDDEDEEERWQKSSDVSVLNRKRYYAQAFGAVDSHPGKKGMIRVKPYVRSNPEYLMDKDRVFGKFISTARAWEMIDLHISRLAV